LRIALNGTDADVPAVDSRHFCASARVIIAGPTAWSER
jgi:hypothetical protein